MKVITDNKWKPFKYRNEVPQSVLNRKFDRMSEDDADNYFDGFFNYWDAWYHLSEFLVIEDENLKSEGWEGVYAVHAFCSIVLKVSPHKGLYMVGRAMY